MAKLIKIDRNGSKHFEGEIACPKCGGSGMIVHHIENGLPSYNWTDGGVCWKCHGSGKVLDKWIERTAEYQAKLDAKRAAKMAELEAQKKAERDSKYIESLAKNGFDKEGKTFIFLGDTFSCKDEIKELGGKFDISIGWHIDHKVDGFDFIEADVNEVASVSDWGVITITANRSEWDSKKKEAQKQLEGDAGFFGAVGQKVQVEVKLIRTASYESKSYYGYGTQTNYIHIMKDSDGHIFVWKTTNVLDVEDDNQFVIRGTIKEHSEYNHDKQTVLTRCKVA